MIALDQWWRIGGAGAILFIVFGIVGLILQGEAPMPNDSAADIRAYFEDDGDQYMVGDVFWGLAFILGVLPFAAALTARLGMAEDEPRPWSRLAFGFAVALGGTLAAISIVGGGLAYSAAEFADDDLLLTLVGMAYYGEVFTSTFLGAGFIFFASFVMVRKKVFWRWLGWSGIATAIAAFVSVFAVFDADPEGALGIFGFVVFLVFAIWILCSGIALLTGDDSSSASS